MSAEVLREAARLMRERAEGSAVAMVGPLTWSSHFNADDSRTCEHYQNMTPAVALAVADVLEAADANYDPEFPEDAESWDFYQAALAVARAYLGDPS